MDFERTLQVIEEIAEEADKHLWYTQSASTYDKALISVVRDLVEWAKEVDEVLKIHQIG